MAESCSCAQSVLSKAPVLSLTRKSLFRLKGCGAAESSCFFCRLQAQPVFLLNFASVELCLIASYRSKHLPPLQALGGTGTEWLLLAEASGALSRAACFYGLRFGDFMHPGKELFSDYSSAAFSLPFKGREEIS